MSAALITRHIEVVRGSDTHDMKKAIISSSILLLAAFVIEGAGSSSPTFQAGAAKVLVAHRGASAYAPEHTAPAYRLAIEQGADYVEQDLAVTKDGVLVSIHDATLERTTNVEEVFPDRYVLDAKKQKRWFAADFTLAEIKRLDAGVWFDAKFAGERILTWDEAVDVVGGRAGLYPEMKTPDLYRERGVNIVEVFAEAVRRRGLDIETPIRGRAPIVLQSFDEQAVRDAARLLPKMPRTMLIGSEAMAQKWMSSADRVKELAGFATDIGPAKVLVEKYPEIVRWAHAAGLTVTPYTFRSADTGGFKDVTAEMDHFLYSFGVDAVFTDNPDKFPRR
jgi:glycerophosphoryl diester phosphodiesterase